MARYIFDNAAQQAGQRFASLEAMYDPWTIRHLEATGLEPGWRCLEVGAGGGSIAAWLAERVGPAGHVLVTDIDPRYLAALAAEERPNVEVQRHDIGEDPLPEGVFDLIHTRLVLIHVPTRWQALGRMMAALKPGGWLVVEDYDSTFTDPAYPTADPADAALVAKVFGAQSRLLAARGGEPGWGRQLYRRFCELGLADVGMEGRLDAWPGGSVGAHLVRANFEQIRTEAIAAGLVTDEEVTRALALLDAPSFAYGSPVLFGAWGRRP
jgi:SAM-dependent methyltransferase